jgi:PGF-CTERM protein
VEEGEIKNEVPPGNYIVEEILKGDWRAIMSTKQTKNVLKGNTATVQFLNIPISLQGDLTTIKFHDPNKNGVQEAGEQGLAWNFSITFPDGGTKRIRTDENEIYTLRRIPVGVYTITEEPKGCRWTSSTDMTQKVDVEPGKEATAPFGNYIAECCMLPGCVWKNSDENIEVCKSVDPCSVALGIEEEITVNLEICVNPEHILNGTKVRDISVIDTLHNQFTIVDGSFSEEPKNDPRKNPDGTTKLEWDIPSLCCEEWRVSFNVTATFALPIDVTEYKRVASKVKYDDQETTVVKELPIPEGKLLFVLPTPTSTPPATPIPKPPGFEALFAIAGLLAVGYLMWRRKR